jgi:hypothetical protein
MDKLQFNVPMNTNISTPSAYSDALSYMEDIALFRFLLKRVIDGLNTLIDKEDSDYKDTLAQLQIKYDELNRIKESIDDLTNKRKLDSNGNFTGSWWGIDKPIHVEGGIDNYLIELQNQVGDLTQLATTDKSKIINAINEIFANVLQINSNISLVYDLKEQGNKIIKTNKSYGAIYFDGGYVGTVDLITQLENIGVLSGTAYFKNWSDITIDGMNTATVEKPFKIIQKYNNNNEIVIHSAYPLSPFTNKFVKDDTEDEFQKLIDFGIYPNISAPYSSDYTNKQTEIFKTLAFIARTVILNADGSNWLDITIGNDTDISNGFPRIAMEYFFADNLQTTHLIESSMLQVFKDFVDWCKVNNRSFVFGGHVTNFSDTIKSTIISGFTYAKSVINVVSPIDLFNSISPMISNKIYKENFKKLVKRIGVVNENLLPSTHMQNFAVIGGTPLKSDFSLDREDYCTLSGTALNNFRCEFRFKLKRDSYYPYPLTFGIDYIKNNTIPENFNTWTEIVFLNGSGAVVDNSYAHVDYDGFNTSNKAVRTMYVTSEIPIDAETCLVNVGFSGKSGTFDLGETRLYNPRLNRGAYPSPFIKKYETLENIEQFTGRYFLGKKVYRKTINFGALPNATTKSVAHGIATIRIYG